MPKAQKDLNLADDAKAALARENHKEFQVTVPAETGQHGQPGQEMIITMILGSVGFSLKRSASALSSGR